MAFYNILPVIHYITAIYNAGSSNGYLKRTISSIQNQAGLGENYEVIMHAVDDKSPDDTADVLKELAAHDSRIMATVNEQNMRLSGVRNFAMGQAVEIMGDDDYVAFLDGDDYLMPGHLDHVIGFMKQYPDIDVFHGQPFIDGKEDIVAPYERRIVNVHETTFEGVLFIRGKALKQAYAQDQKLFADGVPGRAIGHAFLEKLIVEHGMKLAYLPGCRVGYNRQIANESITAKEMRELKHEMGIKSDDDISIKDNPDELLKYDPNNPDTAPKSSLLPKLTGAEKYYTEELPLPAHYPKHKALKL